MSRRSRKWNVNLVTDRGYTTPTPPCKVGFIGAPRREYRKLAALGHLEEAGKWKSRKLNHKAPPFRAELFTLPPWFEHVGMVEGHCWIEAQRRADRKYGHLPKNRHEGIYVSTQPYQPTSWDRVLAEEE